MSEFTLYHLDCEPSTCSLDVLARLAATRLERIGVDWRPMAAAHGLDLDGEPIEGTRIPTRREHAFLEDAARASGDPLFAWKLGDISIRAFGLPGYAVLNAPTVGEALDTLEAVVPAVCEAAWIHHSVDGETAAIAYVNSDSRQNALFVLHFLLNLMRELVGPKFVATRLGLAATEREHLPLFAQQLGPPVTADVPFTFVEFPAKYLALKVEGADARLAETLRPYWQRAQATAAKRPAVIRSRLEGAIVYRLNEGLPGLDGIAQTLRVGRSRVETELGTLGGYRTVVDDLRRRLAQAMVRRTDMTIAAIAVALGYADASALNSAYRRWTGETPKADRDQHNSPSGFATQMDASAHHPDRNHAATRDSRQLPPEWAQDRRHPASLS
ncbi:MAG: AraC family transcriptional regulator ligand-binding domain-containing protein [Geminicoccaceae bacterium]